VKGRSRISFSDGSKWNLSANLAYEKNFAEKHHFDAIAGFEVRQDEDFKEYYSGTNFVVYDTYQDPSLGVNSVTYRSLTQKNSGRSFFWTS